jgi:hypothetical protein
MSWNEGCFNSMGEQVFLSAFFVRSMLYQKNDVCSPHLLRMSRRVRKDRSSAQASWPCADWLLYGWFAPL